MSKICYHGLPSTSKETYDLAKKLLAEKEAVVVGDYLFQEDESFFSDSSTIYVNKIGDPSFLLVFEKNAAWFFGEDEYTVKFEQCRADRIYRQSSMQRNTCWGLDEYTPNDVMCAESDTQMLSTIEALAELFSGDLQYDGECKVEQPITE